MSVYLHIYKFLCMHYLYSVHRCQGSGVEKGKKTDVAMAGPSEERPGKSGRGKKNKSKI